MYRYYNALQAAGVLAIVGLVLALGATVLCCIFVMPKSRRPARGFLAVLHDIVNFNSLFIEKILKVLYVFSTCAVVTVGFLLIFSGLSFWACLALMVLGPIVIRLLYEGMMLLVLGVQNVIEINRKLGGGCAQDPAPVPAFRAPAAAPTPAAPPTVAPYQAPGAYSGAPRMVFCMRCGTRYDANAGPCPACGAVNDD